MIYKRGKTYWYKFVWKGERLRCSTKQGNRRVAEQIEAAHKTRLAKGEVGIEDHKPVPAFDKAMKQFLARSEIENRSSTHQRDVTSSKALLRFFKQIKVDEITVALVQRFKERRSQEKATHKGKVTDRQLRPATVNRELACLRKMFNHVRITHPHLKNPVSEVRFMDEDNLQERVLSFEEQRIYLAACSQPLRDVATMMLKTGMRPEEVYKMHTRDLDLIGRIVAADGVVKTVVAYSVARDCSIPVIIGGYDGT